MEPLYNYLSTVSDSVPVYTPVNVVSRLKDRAKDLSASLLRRATEEALPLWGATERDKTLVGVAKLYVNLGYLEQARSTVRAISDQKLRVEALNHLIDALLKTGTPQSVLQVLGDELDAAA